MINTGQQTIWKQYPKIPFVEANQFGEIRIVDRVVTYKNGAKHLYKGRVLRQYFNKNGYMYVTFSVNNKTINLIVHRVVATCFIPNPDNLPEVNHIDNDRTNNFVDNLEWCTSQYNTDYREKYGVSAKEFSKVLRKPLIAIDLNGFKILWFESQHEAARQLGVNRGNIGSVIKGRHYKTAGGYWFCNADSTAVEKTRNKFGDEVAEKVKKLMSEHL